ncbi:MAG: NAD(P)/FAD-dependent oxidoreductase [Betaproteobacteria bacterium]|nr:NAD(P)/FAD-dependent oxidoreductase [Betaproteobacteria bacterium]
MDRRSFLAVSAALAASGCGRTAKSPAPPPGTLTHTGHELGHRLRDGGLPPAGETLKRKVVIVGAGMSGLSAAWRLQRAGFTDFELLELESSAGGNSRWGQNAVSAFPLGAHYIPLPTPEARAARHLLADIGVLHGNPDAKSPKYEERALVQAPQERLYRNGQWVDNLNPTEGISAEDRDEWQRFAARMRAFQAARGRDGRRAFAIPLAHSSRDPEFVNLDRITMAAWLEAEAFTSEAVHWLVNYATRDDYGCDYRSVSAWAGIHYFACRDSAFSQEGDHDAVLTWPAGNGHVVRKLLERGRFTVRPRALVFRIEPRAKDVALGVFLADEARSVTVVADEVIWAAPFAFAARALAGESDLAAALKARDYAPWITANLTLSEPPYAHHGAPLAWDNVIHDSASLGYVVATHQGVATLPGPTVLTWYFPLAAIAPREGRRKLMNLRREAWVETALRDIEKPHPEIRAITREVDVFANGHAMVVPRPGLIWGPEQARVQAWNAARGTRLHFAHADASGLSLFEEANDRGVAAAEAVLAKLGVKSDTLRYRRA